MLANKPRAAKRFRRRVEVRYGTADPDLKGYSGNISGSGIMIRTTRVFRPGTVITMDILFPSGTVRARGRVSWAREGTISLLASGRIGMGVKFVDPPPDLLRILQEGG